MKQLDTTLVAQVKMLGAELYGVTQLENLQDHNHNIPEEIINRYDKAISIGMVIPLSLLECLTEPQSINSVKMYNHYYNNVIIPTLERISLIITNFLEKSGFKALALPVNLSAYNQKHPVYFHHLVASYAGLGWLGKNNRVVNSNYGTRICCITILTNAELESTESVENGCKQCTLCVDKCNHNALSGIPFHPHHDINDRCDSDKCINFKMENNSLNINYLTVNCGTCLYVCPYNK